MSRFQFIQRNKGHTEDNRDRVMLTKSTTTTIVAIKIGVSINNCTLIQ